MKIIPESETRMVLKDHNITQMIGGGIAFIMGIVVAISTSGNIMAVAIGALVALAGIYVILSTKTVTAVMDKVQNKCSVSLKSILKKEEREFSISDINELVLESRLSYTQSYRKHRTGSTSKYNYSLVFSLKNGERIPLEFGTVSATIVDVLVSPHEKKRNEAKRVADFLGVGLKEVLPPSAGEVLSAIKEGISEGISRSQKPA